MGKEFDKRPEKDSHGSRNVKYCRKCHGFSGFSPLTHTENSYVCILCGYKWPGYQEKQTEKKDTEMELFRITHRYDDKKIDLHYYGASNALEALNEFLSEKSYLAPFESVAIEAVRCTDFHIVYEKSKGKPNE